MPYTYKKLSPEDVPLLKELLKVFGEAFEDIDTYQRAVPRDEYLRGLLSKPHFRFKLPDIATAVTSVGI